MNNWSHTPLGWSITLSTQPILSTRETLRIRTFASAGSLTASAAEIKDLCKDAPEPPRGFAPNNTFSKTFAEVEQTPDGYFRFQTRGVFGKTGDVLGMLDDPDFLTWAKARTKFVITIGQDKPPVTRESVLREVSSRMMMYLGLAAFNRVSVSREEMKTLCEGAEDTPQGFKPEGTFENHSIRVERQPFWFDFHYKPAGGPHSAINLLTDPDFLIWAKAHLG